MTKCVYEKAIQRIAEARFDCHYGFNVFSLDFVARVDDIIGELNVELGGMGQSTIQIPTRIAKRTVPATVVIYRGEPEDEGQTNDDD